MMPPFLVNVLSNRTALPSGITLTAKLMANDLQGQNKNDVSQKTFNTFNLLLNLFGTTRFMCCCPERGIYLDVQILQKGHSCSLLAIMHLVPPSQH